MDKPLFTETSPLGYKVACHKSVWEDHIVQQSGHPIMKDNLHAVQETIATPDVVYGSNEWPNRDVYFKQCSTATYGDKMYTKVIVNTPDVNNDTGSVVTAWPQKNLSGKIDEGNLKYVKPKL